MAKTWWHGICTIFGRPILNWNVIITFFQVFLVFGVEGHVKSMPSGYSLDAELNHHHIFSGISCFWGSGVRQKYAMWVIVGCRIKFRIQRALPIEIWLKTQWDMSKIRTKKVVFFNDTHPQIYIKNPFNTYTVFQILSNFIG